jgi:hypothetical protein
LEASGFNAGQAEPGGDPQYRALSEQSDKVRERIAGIDAGADGEG